MLCMSKLLENKYGYDEMDYWESLLCYQKTKHNKYGFVCVKNPNYTAYEDEREYIVRKPTVKERREIVVNTVMECNGRTFKVANLAKRLGVSDRTIQTTLRQLEKDELIEIIPQYGKGGRQKGNAYRYIGQPCNFYGMGLTLRALHSPKQDVGFRDWAWKDYEFKHNKIWHESTYMLCKKKFVSRMARKRYLEKNGLPLVMPEDVRYLVLRYCYWKGDSVRLHHESVYSQDGTIKIAIEPLNRIERIPFFGYTLSIEIAGTKDNPKITISNAETKEILGAFTWFDENIIECEKRIDEYDTEQFFILGDFTAR